MDEDERQFWANAVGLIAERAGCSCDDVEVVIAEYDLGTVITVEHEPGCRLAMVAKAGTN